MIRIVFALIIASLVVLDSHSQVIADNFEGEGNINWVSSDCNVNTQFSNPFMDSSNPSNLVMRYGDIGGLYANVRFDIAGNFDLSATHSFSLKIYVPSGGLTGEQPNQISLKLQNANINLPWSTQTEIIKSVILDQWQTIDFNFSEDDFINYSAGSADPDARGDLNRLVIQLNGENNADFVLAYIDDFTYSGDLGNGDNPTNSPFDALVWSDEFDSPGAINNEKWYHQTLLPNGNSWFNGEVQHYTDREDNSFVADGFLTILAKKEPFTDQGHTKQYTSARLNSKFAFTYGRVVVRATLPEGTGTWPAIWMLGKNVSENGGYWADDFGDTGWPACGEIDIMEHWGDNQNYVQSAMHTPSSFGNTQNHGGVLASDVANTFHTYMLEWYPDRMEFSLDGIVYYIYEPSVYNAETWPYTEDQYILLNIAVQQFIDPNFVESPMVIDYVRVYQESVLSLEEKEKKSSITLFPNPSSGKLNMHVTIDQVGVKASVYNPVGIRIDTFRLNKANMQRDISDYPSGTYIMVVEGTNGNEVMRFVKL